MGNSEEVAKMLEENVIYNPGSGVFVVDIDDKKNVGEYSITMRAYL